MPQLTVLRAVRDELAMLAKSDPVAAGSVRAATALSLAREMDKASTTPASKLKIGRELEGILTGLRAPMAGMEEDEIDRIRRRRRDSRGSAAADQ